eukprot:scaffold30319_cov50-Prasinocladus_malaysianus.AAC.1
MHLHVKAAGCKGMKLGTSYQTAINYDCTAGNLFGLVGLHRVNKPGVSWPRQDAPEVRHKGTHEVAPQIHAVAWQPYCPRWPALKQFSTGFVSPVKAPQSVSRVYCLVLEADLSSAA